MARSLGFEDGEQAPAAVMLEAARRIAEAVAVPVTADLERGYGDPVGTARAAWDFGLVGLNVEDSTKAGLVPIDEQVAVLRAIRAAVPELVVNARVDVFLRIGGDVDEAVERAERVSRRRRRLCLPDPLPGGLDRCAGASDRRPDQRARQRRHAAAARARGARRCAHDLGRGLATAAYAAAVRIARAALG